MSFEFIAGCAVVGLMTLLHIDKEIEQSNAPQPPAQPSRPHEPTALQKIAHPVQPKNFLDLPRELRDQIYHYAWSGTMITISANESVSKKALITANYYDDHNGGLRRIIRLPRWLSTNRQLREEGLDQWYQNAQFVLSSSYLEMCDLQAIHYRSELFDVKNIRKLQIEEIVASINPPVGVRNYSLTPYAGIVIGTDVESWLAQHVREGMHGLRKATLKIEWLPHNIRAEHTCPINNVFEPLLPENLQSLEIKFISEHDSPELEDRGTVMLTSAQFWEVQKGLTAQCRRLAADKLEENGTVDDNVTLLPQERKCRWRGRVYQWFLAGPERVVKRMKTMPCMW